MKRFHYHPYRRSILAWLVVAGLVSCSSEAGRDEKVAYAYADILRFRDSQPRADSTTVQHGIDSILSRYKLTQDSYLHRFRALADDPTSLRPFFELVQNRLAQTSGLPPALSQDPATD